MISCFLLSTGLVSSSFSYHNVIVLHTNFWFLINSYCLLQRRNEGCVDSFVLRGYFKVLLLIAYIYIVAPSEKQPNSRSIELICCQFILFNQITPIYFLMISIPHPLFITMIRLYNSNFILLELCLCINFKKADLKINTQT